MPDGIASPSSFERVLVLARDAYSAMVAHCVDGAPLEACGMLAGRAGEAAQRERDQEPCVVERSLPAANAARSSRVYTVEPRDLLRADREAEAAGLDLVGVYHSHTHTDAYPSPTDVASAPDPAWHYVVVSLRDVEPTVRSYRIVDGKIEEEPVVLQ